MKIFTILMSAATTFLIVGGGCYNVVLVALAGQPMNAIAFRLCIALGIVAAAKDIRATMDLPPLSNGNYDAIKELLAMRPPKSNEKNSSTPPPH